jgi:uncharacterized membrane protein YfhO
MVGDLFFIDKNYVSNTPRQFASAHEVDQPFQPTPADEEILKDNSIYRVYELQGRLQGRTSYFHKSVGGYSAVRPRRYEQVFDYSIDKHMANLGENIDPKTLSLTKNIPMLDALNVKYLLVEVKDNQMVPITNPFTNGNAWFVSEIKWVNSADAEMKAIDKLDTKNTVVINQYEFGSWRKDNPKNTFQKDSTSTITVNSVNDYKPNRIEYTANNANDGFAVFSENYYKDGWKATVDGKETSIYRVDYVLRGIEIPKGKHTVVFTFEPQVVKTGGTIALFSSLGMLLVIAGGVYAAQKKNKQA